MVTKRDLWNLVIQRFGKDGYPTSKRYQEHLQSCIFSLFNYDEEGSPPALKADVKDYAQRFHWNVKRFWLLPQVHRTRERFESLHSEFLDGELEITRKLQEVPKNSAEEKPPTPPPPPVVQQDQPMEQDEVPENITKDSSKRKKPTQLFMEKVNFCEHFAILF